MWNINDARKIAGLPMIVESRDDNDDGMSAAERELANKAESDLKKKGVKVPKVNPDADIRALAQRRKAKEAKKEQDTDAEEAEAKKDTDVEDNAEKVEPAKKPESKTAAPAKKEEPKAEAEAKRRGKAPNADSKAQRALAWIKANPVHAGEKSKRGEFVKWAAANLEMGSNYASAYYARHNPKSGRTSAAVNEQYWMLSHPSLPSFLLAENKMMNSHQWVGPNDEFDPILFESEAAAMKVARYLADWKNQICTVETVTLTD